MSWTDGLVSLGLVLLVLRQVRGRQVSPAGLLWPVALVAWAAEEYLGGIPAQWPDALFVSGLGAVGLALGLGCGLLTRVRTVGRVVTAWASPAAAALWVTGMLARLAFGVVALHGGAPAIGRLSERLDLHSEETWPTALIVMALCEVLSRTAVLCVRYRAAARGLRAPGAPRGSVRSRWLRRHLRRALVGQAAVAVRSEGADAGRRRGGAAPCGGAGHPRA